MATCVPGMESVVADEINEVLTNVNNLMQVRGKVIFDCAAMPADVDSLRCIDNLYKLHRTFNVGGHKADLNEIGENVGDTEFGLDNGVNRRVIVSASRSGKHSYSRFDVASQAERSLLSGGRFIQGDSNEHDVAIRVDIDGDACAVYRQLTTSRLRFRGGFNSVPGGIRPPLAHCLVRLSKPKSGDVFYDPFCGAGTIAYERSYYKSKKIYASDLNGDVVETAKTNLKQLAIAFATDAANTRMKDGGVDAVVSNLPWGKQIKVNDISGLYRNFFIELKRILAPQGRAVLLTEHDALIECLCEEQGFYCANATRLSLHGLRPSVFIITPSAVAGNPCSVPR
jgi:23S rRNA G2445 N2-methylase RlmL